MIINQKKKTQIHDDYVFFIQAQSEYCEIHSINKKVTYARPLKTMVERLPNFIRVNRSVLINPKHIDCFDDESVTVNGNKFIISRRKLSAVQSQLQLNNITN